MCEVLVLIMNARMGVMVYIGGTEYAKVLVMSRLKWTVCDKSGYSSTHCHVPVGSGSMWKVQEMMGMPIC